MRHSPTVEPLRPTVANGSAPHPVLSTALATLDIQLEEELARYRRSKAGSKVARSPRGRSPKPLDLIAVSARSTLATPDPAPAAAEMVLATGATSRLAATPGLLRSPQVPGIDLAELEAAAEAAGAEAELDDYLASSEELLRSLSEEEAKVQVERGFMRSLVTPLGIGSMLLLLLSSAMFGYVVTNPTSLSGLFASRNDSAQPSLEPGAIAPDPATSGANAAPQPNLASKEFKDLNLNTLGTLKPSGASSPASSPASRPIAAPSSAPKSPPTLPPTASTPAPQGNPSLPVIPVSPRQPEPAPDPAPQTYQPEPVRDTTPAPPQPPAQPAPPSSDEAYRYKVVAPYEGDRSLEDTRKIVPDAFVTNASGKAETQVGAHSSAADAEMQVQELRRQGIQAEVQKR